MLVPQSCEGDRGCAERGLLQVREGGWLRRGVPTGAISDGTFCEFYIGLRTLGDHYICKESTVEVDRQVLKTLIPLWQEGNLPRGKKEVSHC